MVINQLTGRVVYSLLTKIARRVLPERRFVVHRTPLAVIPTQLDNNDKNSYLAIKRFNVLRQKYGLVVNYKPMDVMQTFDQMGGLPPAKRHSSRQRYRMAELKRWAAHLDVPINFTPTYCCRW